MPYHPELAERPLVSYEVIVTLIAPTATRAGLPILSGIEETEFATAIKNTDVLMDALSTGRNGFHGEWNDTFVPRH